MIHGLIEKFYVSYSQPNTEQNVKLTVYSAYSKVYTAQFEVHKCTL